MAERIGCREFQPGLNHIERPSGKGVADLGIDNESLDCGHCTGCQGIFREQVHGDDRTAWPDLVDFRNDCLACEPLLDQLDLLVRSGKVQHLWDKGIGGEDAVLVDHAVGVASGVLRQHFVHVAVLALEFSGFVGVPRAILPIVVLVLELHESPAIHALVQILFMTCAAEFSGLRVFRAVIQLVLLGMQPDEGLGYFSENGTGREFEQVGSWGSGNVVRIAAHVRLAQDMAKDAGVTGLRGWRSLRGNSLAGEQRDGLVAAGAITARSEPAGLDVVGFYRRIEGVRAGKMMRAWKPLFVDRGVATGGAAGFRVDEELRWNHPAGIRAGVGRAEISGRECPLMAADPNDDCTDGKHHGPEDKGLQKLDVATLWKFASDSAAYDME